MIDTATPSPELYVGHHVFVAWLLALVLYVLSGPLKRWLHHWPLARRRQVLIGLFAIWVVIWFFGTFDVLGFQGGASLLWFLYLFAVGDWLSSDQALLNRVATGRLWLATIATFLLGGVMSWLKMDKVAYNPHHGLTLSTHYLTGINTYQPIVLLFCALALVAWKKGHPKPLSEVTAVRFLLLLGLLGMPKAVTPILLPSVNWSLAILLGVFAYLALLWLPVLIAGLAKAWKQEIHWQAVGPWLRSGLRRWWPLLAVFAVLWLLAVLDFALRWEWDPTMITWAVTKRSAIIIVNALIAFALFAILGALTNRWWLSGGITISALIGWLVATQLKIASRDEPILPTDLSTITAPKELLGMVDPKLLIAAVVGIIVLIVFFAWFEHRHGAPHRLGWPSRIALGLVAILYLFSFTRVNHSKSIVYKQLQSIGDTPYFYAQLRGAKMNGSLLQFANNIDVTVMAKPSGYSEARMEKIQKRYTKAAKAINQNRDHQSTKGQNLVFVLSESFADPSRLPGIKISGGDPLSYLHQLKKETTSGLMLSSGYGGGTANMEYMALTSLSVANFSATMPTPYSQLVPYQSQTFTINNLFDHSLAIHPFTANLYSRKTVYKQFGFEKFYHLDGGSPLTYRAKIDNSPRISDHSTYQEIMLHLKQGSAGKFVQVATMQNHMPYETSYYSHLNYQVSGSGVTSSKEKDQIETYVQGIHYTDEALKKWIKQLDKLDQPTTVVWYGDHLPGIYSGISMGKYGVALHETDYFIYSNKAARNQNTDRLKNQHQLVSPNTFAAMALAKMDVKVSPYYALMTEVLEKIPATALPINGTNKNNTASQGGTTFVNQKGKVTHLTKKQKQLYDDYKLVQYDLTAGHHYLFKKSFLKKVP